ncbi:MAG: nucleotidyltransferase family protein, partial [Sphingomicrobium sp.]
MPGPSPLRSALTLVTACCRWPDDEARRAAVGTAAAQVEAWAGVRALAAAHRVEGLVAQALEAADVPLSERMALWRAEAAGRIRSGALLQVRDTLRIAAAFGRAGIAFRVLKGAPLAAAAFGTVALKHSWDIDVLVDPRQAVAAAAAMSALGYAAVKPPRPLDAAEFARWSAVAKDAEFQAVGCAPVELHWRLLDLPFLMAGLGVHGDERRIALLGDAAVPTFVDSANLAYLAVHGAAAGWSRLKWIADFSALLAAQPDPAAAVAAARRYSTGFALDQALLVRHCLFGTGLPAGWRDGSRVRRLTQHAMTVIRARSPDRPIERDPAALLAIRRSRRMLKPGP